MTKAYNGKRAIKKEKLDDLKKLARYIPAGAGYDNFYSAILNWPIK